MSAAATDKMPGNEGVYIDKDGNKADADIHEPILNGISPEADRKYRLRAFRRAVDVHGIPAEQAARLYGLDPSDL
jgi:hypothetical protein